MSNPKADDEYWEQFVCKAMLINPTIFNLWRDPPGYGHSTKPSLNWVAEFTEVYRALGLLAMSDADGWAVWRALKRIRGRARVKTT